MFEAQSTQDARRDAKQMRPVDMNGSVHTARKHHQRICVRICARASCVHWAQRSIPDVPAHSFRDLKEDRILTVAAVIILDGQS